MKIILNRKKKGNLIIWYWILHFHCKRYFSVIYLDENCLLFLLLLAFPVRGRHSEWSVSYLYPLLSHQLQLRSPMLDVKCKHLNILFSTRLHRELPPSNSCFHNQGHSERTGTITIQTNFYSCIKFTFNICIEVCI